MKRFALLIANTNGLAGTRKDLSNFTNFLISAKGGAWSSGSEIYKSLYDPSLEELRAVLSVVKDERFDYVIVLFSGHGGQRKETVLEINKNGEVIYESELKGLAKRQLTVFDCCRVIDRRTLDSAMNKSMGYFSESSDRELRELVRRKYDERIMQSIEQQATLYSCSIGQSSYDTPDGAVYLSCLIKAAQDVQGEFKLVGPAHQEAKDLTERYVWNKHQETQVPEAVLPKCLSPQQLIISINPAHYILRG